MTTPTAISIAVCDRLEVNLEKFKHVRGNYRTHHAIVEARAVSAWLMRVMLGMTYPEIARFIGLASHADVMRLVKRIAQSDRLVDLSHQLWFELEEIRPDAEVVHLQKKVTEFEREAGLQLIR